MECMRKQYVLKLPVMGNFGMLLFVLLSFLLSVFMLMGKYHTKMNFSWGISK